MSIKTNYNFKCIEVKDAIIRVDRLFGSSKEGWNSLVGVYNITTEEVPADEENGVEATTRTVYNKLEEFNHSAPYVSDERGYITMYKSLQNKFGGERNQSEKIMDLHLLM